MSAPDRASAEGLREDQRARIVPLDRACGTSYTCVFASGHDGLHSFEQFAVERAALATPDRADYNKGWNDGYNEGSRDQYQNRERAAE